MPKTIVWSTGGGIVGMTADLQKTKHQELDKHRKSKFCLPATWTPWINPWINYRHYSRGPALHIRIFIAIEADITTSEADHHYQ